MNFKVTAKALIQEGFMRFHTDGMQGVEDAIANALLAAYEEGHEKGWAVEWDRASIIDLAEFFNEDESKKEES